MESGDQLIRTTSIVIVVFSVGLRSLEYFLSRISEDLEYVFSLLEYKVQIVIRVCSQLCNL